MNLNDIDSINQGDTESAINAYLTEGVNKIRRFQYYDAEAFLEKSYSLSHDLVLNKNQNENNKSLSNQYEKFADIFSKYTFSLYLQHTKNPLKFMDVVTKFKKQNEEKNKELNQKVIEAFLTDCEEFYPRITQDLSSNFYMTWNPFPYISQKLESDKSGQNLQLLNRYLKILKRCANSLKNSTINEISCAIMNNFINHYDKDLKKHEKKLRTVDETQFKDFILNLQQFLKGSNLKQLEKFENDVLLDFLMSDFLGKQFYALRRFNSYPTFSKDILEQIRQRDVVNKLLFKSNLHHELIQQFSQFLSKLFGYGFYEDTIIEQLWTKTFEKTDDLEDYFKAWPILQSSIPSKSQKFFWNLVLTRTPSFSSPHFHTFLIQIAPNCSEKDKISMIDLLWKSATDSTTQNCEEFVDIINEYIPAENGEFRDDLKQRCFSLFQSDDKDEKKQMFSLKLLIKIWKNVTEKETNEDFDFLLKNCKLTINNASPFLALLSTIASNFNHPFTDEEMELIKNQITEIINVNSMLVFNFIQRLLSIQKGHLFTSHLLFSLLEWMTKLENVDSVTFKLIRMFYEMIHSSTKHHRVDVNDNDINNDDYLNKAVDSLWDLLFRTNIPDVADFLVKVHLKNVLNKFKKKKKSQSKKKGKSKNKKNSKSKEKKSDDSDSENQNVSSNNNSEIASLLIREFIEKCFQKLDCFGSLTALNFLILEIEESLNLEKYDIQRNVFDGYKQKLTILLTKDYTGEVSIPEGTSYYTFRKIVRELIKLNDSQITLMSGQNKLSQNHVFQNNEKIKVFFNTIEQEENNAVVGQVKKNADSDSESGSNSSSESSSSSSFSFDVNSFDIEWEKESLPSQILSRYRGNIKRLLDSKDTLICEATLNLLNLLSIDENEVNLLKTKSDLFDVEHPFLFMYRLNLLANLVKKKDMDVLNNIFNSDLFTQLMNIIIKMDRNLFTKDEYFDLLLETVVYISKIGSDIKELRKPKRNCLKELLVDADSPLSSIMNWVIEEEKMKPVNSLRVIDFLVILSEFIQIDKNLLIGHQRFQDLFDLTLFNENQSIRVVFYNLLTHLKTSRIQKFFLSRLNFSRKRKCTEYFNLLQRIVKFGSSFENNKFLFDTLVDSLNDNLFVYNEIKVKTKDQSLIDASRDLCADLSFPDFIKGIIDNLEFIFPTIYNQKSEEEEKNENEEELKKKPELLLHILVDKIVFNTNRYVYSPPSLFSLVKMILNRFPSLFPPLIQSLTIFNDSIQDVKSTYLNLCSPDKKFEKGMNNLGCTCYLNASIQQLFHIKEIRDAIFQYDPTEDNDFLENKKEKEDNDEAISKNWLCQLQLLMANLKYAPLTSVDATDFVSNWKMYGNEPIDPNEQQDAIEFLQILLDRLDERIPGRPISKIIRGQIIHTIKQINGDYQSQSFEDFITFTLEVINKKNFNDSFDAFLEPDIFDGDNKYNVEELGKIDATRYHAIKKAPEILIFQLKRFDFDLSTLKRKKINTAYQIDMEVDISRLLFDKDQNNNDLSCIYELFGIVEHSGSAEGGHYTSFIKSSEICDEDEEKEKEEESSSSVWRIYNDSRVAIIDEKEVIKRATGGTYTRRVYDPVTQTVKVLSSTRIDSAYILFYRKKPTNENEKKKSNKNENSNEIEIEEEEEDIENNDNNNKRSVNSVNSSEMVLDEPIQFMPEIMLSEFFKNMKQLILRHVLYSNEYINFIDYISKVDNFDTFSFIYQYTMKSIVSMSNHFKSSSIIQAAMKKASNDLNFARYILKKENNLLISTLLNFTEEKQASMCCSLADAALSVIFNANKEKHVYDEDSEFIEAIIENKEKLVQQTDKFDFIFRPFYFYLVLGNVSYELSKKYMDFFLDLLESIQAKHKEESLMNLKEKGKKYQSAYLVSNDDSNETNISIGETPNISLSNESTSINLHSRIDFKSINMLHVFKSMVFLIEQNDFEKKDLDYFNSIKKRVINHEFLNLWSQSRYHTSNFNCFVVQLLKDDKKMTQKYFDFICNANHILIGNETQENESVETENESVENENESSEKSDNELKTKGKVKFKLNSKNKNKSTKSKNKDKSSRSHHNHHHHHQENVKKASARKDISRMTIQTLSSIFVNLLAFKDSLTSFRVDWFLNFTEKLKWSQIECENFLSESANNVRGRCREFHLLANFTKKDEEEKELVVDPCPLFDNDSPYIFKKFLFSNEQSIRSHCVSFIYSMFPSFPCLKMQDGKVTAEKPKTKTNKNTNASINKYFNHNNYFNNNNNYNYEVPKFRKESEQNVKLNANSNDESSDSDATEGSAHNENKNEIKNENEKVSDVVVDGFDRHMILELCGLIKVFNTLMNAMKDVVSISREIAANIDSYHGTKAIPTDTFFDLLSWSSFHLIDAQKLLNESSEAKTLLTQSELDFLLSFDLSKHSSTFSVLITKFSNFKNNVRCSMIDLLKFVFIIFSKGSTDKDSGKKNVLVDSSNSLVYLTALSKIPPGYETSNFVDSATFFFLPVVTPFADRIEQHLMKSKFVELSIKSALGAKSSAANSNEENYYASSSSSAVNGVSNSPFFGRVVTEFLAKMKVSEKLCSLLWKKRKAAAWGGSSLLLKVTKEVLRKSGWTAVDYFTEFGCIALIVAEFESQHEVQQMNFYNWELMLDVVHAYNLCYIRKQKESDGHKDEDSEEEGSGDGDDDVESKSSQKVKSGNSKGSHNFLKKFTKNFVELWRLNQKFLALVNSYLKKSTVNYSVTALKILSEVILFGGSFSPELLHFGLKMISNENEEFLSNLKNDEIREKYAKLEVEIVRRSAKVNGRKNDRKTKKSKNDKKAVSSGTDNDDSNTNSDVITNGYSLIERDANRQLQTKLFNSNLFAIFVNEIENDEVKSNLYINFFKEFNDISQIDEEFVKNAAHVMKQQGHSIQPPQKVDNKIVMTKKEKKKLDSLKSEDDPDILAITRNLSTLTENEILRVSPAMGAMEAEEVAFKLELAEKAAAALREELNADVKFAPLKKARVEKVAAEIAAKKEGGDIYGELARVVERIVTNNVNKK